MPNSTTANGQARAVRGYEAKTPEYEIEPDFGLVPPPQNDSLRSPTLGRPALSRSSSAGSTSSNRNLLRRILIDRPTTPTRPTFPPPSASTYTPLPPSGLTPLAKINLFINQTISIALSTVFLAFVVSWAGANELLRFLPKWLRGTKGKVFPWDDDKYWRKEGGKISKEPADYARQVGMDIVDQEVETEDGYYLK
jgi:lysosomal acid lipase/cholesteryl ester hydrolase